MKKRLFYGSFIILSIFSFYFINKIVEKLKEKDPILEQVKAKEELYTINPINAQIIGNSIISGKVGQGIDYQKTYQKMKEYGAYSESFITLKEVKPTISIEDHYDKYIIKGNPTNRKIALVFPIKTQEEIQPILSILDTKNTIGTFFIEGTYLEKNISYLKKHLNHEYELLSYDNSYEEIFFKTALSYLESITNQKPSYCYSETKNDSLIKLCQKLKLHTMKPTVKINKNLYQNVKENIDNSMIFSLEINPYIKKELALTIDYIQQKGYQIVSLKELLSES